MEGVKNYRGRKNYGGGVLPEGSVIVRGTSAFSAGKTRALDNGIITPVEFLKEKSNRRDVGNWECPGDTKKET